MAKGDDKRARNRIDQQYNLSQQKLNNLDQGLQDRQNENAPRYNTAANEAMGDYRNIMDQYRNFQTTGLQHITPERVNYERPGEMNEAFGGYRNFMNTGGFSDQDIQNMRARGISPIRSVYQNLNNELSRQRALQGGYSPNFGAVAAKMGRNSAQQIADQVENVNARIAEQVQQGKMFGTTGMGGLSVQDAQLAQNAALANQRAGLEAGRINAQTVDPLRLEAIGGQARLFGTAPGMAGQFGNQLSQSTQDLLNAQQMQQQLSLGTMGAQNQASQIPGRWENTVGRIGDVMKIGAAAANPFLAQNAPDTGNLYGGSVYNNGPNGEFW